MLHQGQYSDVYVRGDDKVIKIFKNNHSFDNEKKIYNLVEQYVKDKECDYPKGILKCEVIDNDDEKGLLFDRVNDGDLYDLTRNTILDSDDTNTLFLKICDIVKFLHDLDIVIGDIKQENILIRKDVSYEPVLIDFETSSVSTSDVIGGTLEYLSPEGIKDMKIDRCADIWALGVLLYELHEIEHRSPFGDRDNHTYSEIYRSISNIDIDPNNNHIIDADVLNICKKIFVKKDERITLDELINLVK